MNNSSSKSFSISELEKQIEKLIQKNIELEKSAYINAYILNHSADLISHHSLDGRYTHVSSSYKSMLGYEPEELIGVSPYDLFYEGHIEAIRNSHNTVLSSNAEDIISYKIRHKNGSYIWIESYVISINTKNFKEIICISRNITKNKKTENDLCECKRRQKEAEALAHVGSWELDLSTQFLWASSEAFRIYGIVRSTSQIPIIQFLERILPKYRIRFESMMANITNSEKFESEFKIRRLDNGSIRLLYTKAESLYDTNGNVIKVIGVVQDITERKKRAEKKVQISYMDELTGTYNKEFIMNEIKRLNDECHYPFSIIIGDINGLKAINNKYGRAVGDELLRKFASKMKKFCRSHDIVARFGKDEIIILFHDTDEKAITNICYRMNNNICYNNNSLEATFSYGYGTKTDNHITVDEFIQAVEKRMIKGKYVEGITLI